jgi:molecular chaperone GrpE
MRIMTNDSMEQDRFAAAGTDSAAETPDGTVDRLEKELAEASDRALRIQAELENYRKRMHRELAEERRYAIVPFAKDLLAVVDNLERAIQAAQNAEEKNSLLEGVKMVATQLEGVLAQHQCQRIEAVGQPFDPNLHQAIAQEASTLPAGTVSRDVQSGYKLHDRVIRPAQVFVSSGPAQS